jgi:trehalose synthase-fused probable maltokinase
MVDLKTTHSWSSFLEDSRLRKHLVDKVLPDFLMTRRWFGAKSANIKKHEIEIHLKYSFGGELVHLLMIEVTFQTSNSDTYLLPLSFRMREDFEPEGLIANLDVNGNKGWLVDALHVPVIREGLFRNVQENLKLDVGAGTLDMERGSALAWKPGEELVSRLLNAEQSNSTIVFNDKYYLKIYRKLYRGLNPDFEVSRFLSEKTGFHNTPAYCGSVTWNKPGFYKVTLGLMQLKVDNQGDAWPYFLGRVEAYFRRLQASGLAPTDLAKVPLYKPLNASKLPEPYPALIGEDTIQALQLLAKRTVELHLALFLDRSDTAFTPIPYSEDYKVWLLNRILYMLDHRITTMESVMPNLSPQARVYAEEFLARKVEVKNRILSFDESHLNSSRIRIHGDFHLGQILRTEEDFYFLDFEGEPEATIRDRKVKHSPLKDVAGLIRSFHYAVFATIFGDHNFKMSEENLAEAGGRYYRAIVAVFLDTYLNTAFDNGLNIGYYQEIDFLLRYHIFEKAIYELGYELNSRPDWVIIPLKGLNQILNND